MNGLLRAIEHQGGLTALARALTTPETVVTKGVVYGWKMRGIVPPEYCPPIERLTGVRCEDLNDKVDWPYLRTTQPHDEVPL